MNHITVYNKNDASLKFTTNESNYHFINCGIVISDARDSNDKVLYRIDANYLQYHSVKCQGPKLLKDFTKEESMQWLIDNNKVIYTTEPTTKLVIQTGHI